MNFKKLIICDFKELFKILYEIKNELNYEIIETTAENLLNISLDKKDDHLFIVKKLVKNLSNQILITSLPIKLSKLVEKLNIEFLKRNFHSQSELKIQKYKLDVNSRELFFKDKKIKLTEKESNIILYISNSIKPVSIEDLQLNVWGYHSDLETHTVETHIYRLRKKILATFDDNDFINSKKNGYQIN